MSVTDARLTIRIDPKVKNDAGKVYESLGINLSTAVNVFLRKSIAIGGFPLSVTNDATLKAIENSRNGIGNSKNYADVNELWNDLNREE